MLVKKKDFIKKIGKNCSEKMVDKNGGIFICCYNSNCDKNQVITKLELWKIQEVVTT